jgi:hypothetical protein
MCVHTLGKGATHPEGRVLVVGHPCWGSVHKCIFRYHHFPEGGDLPRQSLSRPRGRLREVLSTNAEKSKVRPIARGALAGSKRFATPSAGTEGV